MTGAVVWTEPRVTALKSLWARGWTGTQIAKEINRLTGSSFTRNAILGATHRLSMPSVRPLLGPKKHRQHRNSRKRERRMSAKAPQMAPERLIRAESIEAPPPRNLSILGLATGDCRWPVTDGPPYLFCGNPALYGCSYCAAHMSIAHDRRGDHALAKGLGPAGAPNWNIPR